MSEASTNPWPWPFVRSVVHVAETASTNDIAKADAPSIDPEVLPRLYRADRQTNGRGRGANAWYSDSGSLLISLLIDPRRLGLTSEREMCVSLAVGLAVLRTVEIHIVAKPLGIRWPNDVEIGGRKLAGILVERLVAGSESRLVVGIGINVSTRFEHAPPEVASLATSLSRFEPELESPRAMNHILTRLLSRIGCELGRLSAGERWQVWDWNRADLLSGQPVVVQRGLERLEGIGRGIAEDGALLLETPAHPEPIRVYAGQILR